MSSVSSDIQPLSYGAWLEVKRQYYHNCSVLCCVRQLCTTVGLYALMFSFSVPSQEIGWEERLRHYVFCVE